MSTERKAMQDFHSGETHRILEGLGLSAVNPGASSGDGWHAAADAPLIDSINPATGDVIARVRAAGADDYERVMRSAAAAFADWLTALIGATCAIMMYVAGTRLRFMAPIALAATRTTLRGCVPSCLPFA